MPSKKTKERIEKLREYQKNYHRKYRIKHTNINRRYALKRKYGITLEDWEKLFTSQGKACAICYSKEPRSKQGWHTDHCHVTNRIRGILCNHCNRTIHKYATIKVLRRAIRYLIAAEKKK